MCHYHSHFIENDRKTNVDVLEANKQANKEDVRRLREENKELRQKLAHMQRVMFPSPIISTHNPFYFHMKSIYFDVSLKYIAMSETQELFVVRSQVK